MALEYLKAIQKRCYERHKISSKDFIAKYHKEILNVNKIRLARQRLLDKDVLKEYLVVTCDICETPMDYEAEFVLKGLDKLHKILRCPKCDSTKVISEKIHKLT